MKEQNFVSYGDKSQQQRRDEIIKLMKECDIPDNELLLNTGLFLVPQTLSRILFMDFLYRQILDVQGIIIDFGTRWGQNLSLFTSMRGIYEPYNRLRKIVAFDTFEGFVRIDLKDGDSTMMKNGNYSVPAGYEKYLNTLITLQEAESPLAHIKKFEVIKGDAPLELEKYLDSHPETIIALAYFDFDLYEPTRDCLKLIRDRLTKKSVLGFDEINDADCPGETLALKEVLGLNTYGIKRFPYNSRTSYLVIE
jgi:hypothetical protein